ncbi:MAG TPA: DUF4279 domain-containing protein [Saprospiraceae bacterium]|nr:DUF4279 domain-containing protein [Saprospiraceae bacterium]HPN68865.1 DUF4279 domain-containing protein [Saprospiraceae bacterium]
MSYQKLTYVGDKSNNYLYFAFDADFFDLNLVTSELNINPTSVMIKKKPVPKSTSWKYQIDAREDINLELHIEKLIDIFEKKVLEINQLKVKLNLKTRLQFVISIDISLNASLPFFGLNERTIDFLGKTGTEVDFDLYKTIK